MLSSITRPAIGYDLIGLATDSTVSVGRAGDANIRLDSPEVPFLLSRRHAVFSLGSDGSICLRDLASTNGTYVARRSQSLRKLAPDSGWTLQNGDTVDTIIARGSQVGNPFLFKYYSLEPEPASDAGPQLDQQHVDSGLQADESMAPAGPPDGPVEMEDMELQPITAIPLQQQAGDDSELLDNAGGGMPLLAATGRRSQRNPHTPKRRVSAGKENRSANGLPTVTSAATPKSTKMTELISNHLTCPICCEWLLACHTLSCGHMFCGLCLATWLVQKQSCPSCRKPIAGIPVRCFQVDNTITDLLGFNQMSPATNLERKRKQEHWEGVQNQVVQRSMKGPSPGSTGERAVLQSGGSNVST
ncbi:E3 ubiquitin-protein ligase [Haematococcus lacustris]|uniref:E3 ubiquitin-protein ligase CHFR n=1 Tax=Haematococcus lacustris TaxID=44745 RepID=A0A699ZTH8_HAELA|nr:E3 ubiquitin-protein ligase [Haematococcus lacustris]